MAIVVNVESGVGVSGHIYFAPAIAESRGHLRQTVAVVHPKTAVDAQEAVQAFGIVASMMGFAQDQEHHLYISVIRLIVQALRLLGVESLPEPDKVAFVDFTVDTAGNTKIELKHYDHKAGGSSLPTPSALMHPAGHA